MLPESQVYLDFLCPDDTSTGKFVFAVDDGDTSALTLGSNLNLYVNTDGRATNVLYTDSTEYGYTDDVHMQRFDCASIHMLGYN